MLESIVKWFIETWLVGMVGFLIIMLTWLVVVTIWDAVDELRGR